MTGNMRPRDGQAWGAPPRESTRSGGPAKPQIYVHFEFGMSFSQKHGPKPHTMTYRSKALKERQQQQSATSRTNNNSSTSWLLQPTPQHYHHNTRPRALTHNDSISSHPPPAYDGPSSNHHNNGVYSLPSSDPFATPSPPIERGGSAPPPMNVSPWDAEPEPVGFSALPRPRASSGRGFGNDGMPLSANSDPTDDMPFEEDPAEARRRRQNGPADAGHARDLATLSSAMMTVDNGFEDQWWYQGGRQPAVPQPVPAAPVQMSSRSLPSSPTEYEDDGVGNTFVAGSTLGWAIARDEVRPMRTSSLRAGQMYPQLTAAAAQTMSPATQQRLVTEEWVQATRQFSTLASGSRGHGHSRSDTPVRDVVSPLTEYYQPVPLHRTGSELWIYK